MRPSIGDLNIGSTVYLVDKTKIKSATITLVDFQPQLKHFLVEVGLGKNSIQYWTDDADVTYIPHSLRRYKWLTTTSAEASELMDRNRVDKVKDVRKVMTSLYKELWQWDIPQQGFVSQKDVERWFNDWKEPNT
jgi:hypothetical protein